MPWPWSFSASPQLGDDLLHAEPLRWHRPPPFGLSDRQGTTLDLDRMRGGRTLPTNIVRTVNENAKVLKFQSFGFEEE